MGMGDELMAMGEAAAMSKQYGGPVCILDKGRRPRWSQYFEGAPYIRPRGDPRGGLGIQNGPGCRPYVESYDSTRWKWQRYQPIPANLDHITGTGSAAGRVVIEPRLKPSAPVNKQWPDEYWRDVVRRLPALTLGRRPVVLGSAPYPGADLLMTPTFRDLVQTMRGAALYVGHEGGLHHLAAALGVRAVVIFGGYIGPEHSGYHDHINLTGGAEACGNRLPCHHCAVAMRAIDPVEVLEAAMRALDRHKQPAGGEI